MKEKTKNQREARFAELKKHFDTEVLGVYDANLRGDYFINQRQLNHERQWVDYSNGGEELARKGADYTLSAGRLYEKEFMDLLEKLDRYHEQKYRSISGESEKPETKTKI